MKEVFNYNCPGCSKLLNYAPVPFELISELKFKLPELGLKFNHMEIISYCNNCDSLSVGYVDNHGDVRSAYVIGFIDEDLVKKLLNVELIEGEVKEVSCHDCNYTTKKNVIKLGSKGFNELHYCENCNGMSLVDTRSSRAPFNIASFNESFINGFTQKLRSVIS